ncbi:MAG: hypothetical protein IKU59_05290 [Bacteroidales bacterium]|nr:hypothetical protein [Bacteroidales bacterium]
MIAFILASQNSSAPVEGLNAILAVFGVIFIKGVIRYIKDKIWGDNHNDKLL